ncbi:MAG: hypothetical protein KDD52_08230 [Bdellovibrionales bacterium]|nr:hypothetical protein [Bdellovibrionales bacterium]
MNKTKQNVQNAVTIFIILLLGACSPYGMQVRCGSGTDVLTSCGLSSNGSSTGNSNTSRAISSFNDDNVASIELDFGLSEDENGQAQGDVSGEHEIQFCMQSTPETCVTISGDANESLSLSDASTLNTVGLFSCTGTYDHLQSCNKNPPNVGVANLPDPSLAYDVKVRHRYRSSSSQDWSTNTDLKTIEYQVRFHTDNETVDRNEAALPNLTIYAIGGPDQVSPSNFLRSGVACTNFTLTFVTGSYAVIEYKLVNDASSTVVASPTTITTTTANGVFDTLNDHINSINANYAVPEPNQDADLLEVFPTQCTDRTSAAYLSNWIKRDLTPEWMIVKEDSSTNQWRQTFESDSRYNR